MPYAIQSGEYSTDGGLDGAAYISDSDGNPNVFNVERNDNGKLWLDNDWTNPDNRWNLDNRIVFRLRNSLHFSPRSGGAEFLVSCPFHPPSILPTSSIFSESAIYFLTSSDFASHKTMSNNFSASTFLAASRTYGSFSSRGRNAAAEVASTVSMNRASIFAPNEYRCSLGISEW